MQYRERIVKAGDVGANKKRDIFFMSFVATPDVNDSTDCFSFNEEVFEDKIVKVKQNTRIRKLIRFILNVKISLKS